MKNNSDFPEPILMHEYIMPKDTNPLGLTFGGKIFSLMDICANIAVKKHTGRNAVTAGAEKITFINPSYSGDILSLKAKILSKGQSSIRIKVTVSRDSIKNSQPEPIAEGFFTFVVI